MTDYRSNVTLRIFRWPGDEALAQAPASEPLGQLREFLADREPDSDYADAGEKLVEWYEQGGGVFGLDSEGLTHTLVEVGLPFDLYDDQEFGADGIRWMPGWDRPRNDARGGEGEVHLTASEWGAILSGNPNPATILRAVNDHFASVDELVKREDERERVVA